MNNVLFKEQFHVHVTLMNILHRYIFYESLLANAEKGWTRNYDTFVFKMFV